MHWHIQNYSTGSFVMLFYYNTVHIHIHTCDSNIYRFDIKGPLGSHIKIASVKSSRQRLMLPTKWSAHHRHWWYIIKQGKKYYNISFMLREFSTKNMQLQLHRGPNGDAVQSCVYTNFILLKMNLFFFLPFSSRSSCKKRVRHDL